MANRVKAANTVTIRPSHHTSRQNMTRAPSSSNPAPNTRTANCEKKLESAVTSPSTRSISSPGVRSLWKLMSRFSRCAVRSTRSLFVAAQPTSAPM